MKDLEIIESESFFNRLTSLAKLTLFLYQHMEYEELSIFSDPSRIEFEKASEIIYNNFRGFESRNFIP